MRLNRACLLQGYKSLRDKLGGLISSDEERESFVTPTPQIDGYSVWEEWNVNAKRICRFYLERGLIVHTHTRKQIGRGNTPTWARSGAATKTTPARLSLGGRTPAEFATICSGGNDGKTLPVPHFSQHAAAEGALTYGRVPRGSFIRTIDFKAAHCYR